VLQRCKVYLFIGHVMWVRSHNLISSIQHPWPNGSHAMLLMAYTDYGNRYDNEKAMVHVMF
jgi:hypothetical protein